MSKLCIEYLKLPLGSRAPIIMRFCSWSCAEHYAKYAQTNISYFQENYELTHKVVCSYGSCDNIILPADNYLSE
jgi:hypothetical protein